ncbi:hypothetical protein DSL72_008914 [Monilinia vaccinii-corymbosi]|uniref:SAP domain-containing protein n=1 Tax=Monilinia vaccinii-corymbosi TaxID=61207 RepID=A0A8A3PSH1_9HELO|nr:hypothetical protein DSL72_008914 [Monilinia vaccinii-corymbosi]
MSWLRDDLGDMESDDLFGEEDSSFDENAMPDEKYNDIDYDPRAVAIAQGVLDPNPVEENRPTAPRVSSGENTGSLNVESTSSGDAQLAVESPKPDGELQTSGNILNAHIRTDAMNPIETPPEKGASGIPSAEIEHGTVGTSSGGLGKFHRGNVAPPPNPGSHHVQSSISRATSAGRSISKGPAASPRKRITQPSRPGSSSRVRKSKKHARRPSTFPWKYGPLVNFAPRNALAGPRNPDQETALDEGESDEDSQWNFDEEPSPQPQNSNHPIIDLTDDDDDEEFQSESLPLNSAQNASSASVQQPGFSYPPAAFNNAPPAAPNYNIPQPQTAQEILMVESPQSSSAQTQYTPSSMHPNSRSPSRMDGHVNKGKSTDSDPGSSIPQNATKGKSRQLEPSQSAAPEIERHDPSPNEHSSPMNLNLHVRTGQQNMNPSSHAQIGPQYVNHDMRMQARLQVLNANIHVNIAQEDIQNSEYMMFRVPELKQLLKDRKIPRHGIKCQLIKRLMESDARQIVVAQHLVQQLSQPLNAGPAASNASQPVAGAAYGMGLLNNQPQDPQGREMPPVYGPSAGAYAQMGFNNAAQPSIPVHGAYLQPVTGGHIESSHQRLQYLKAYLFQRGDNQRAAKSFSSQPVDSTGGQSTNGGTQQPTSGNLVGRANGLQQNPAPDPSRGPQNRVAQQPRSEDSQRNSSGLPQGLMQDAPARSASPGLQQPANGSHGRNIDQTTGLDLDDPLGMDIMSDMDQTLADLMR